MTASRDFGLVLALAIPSASTTDITLARLLPKPKVHTIDEVDCGKPKRNRKLKTKPRGWSIRRCHRGREQQYSLVCQDLCRLRRVKTQVARNYQALVVLQHLI